MDRIIDMPHILIVEDERAIADTLVYALQMERFDCTWLSLGGDALLFQKQTPADLWVLDVGLPDLDGFEVCRQLRRFSEVPVIFLTARDTEIDRIVGLEIGADDYVTKPFSPREVSARVKAILKRTANANKALVVPLPESVDKAESLFYVDEAAIQVYLKQAPLNLTRHEFNLLCCLLSQPKRVFSREQLLDAIGVAVDAGYERNIDTHIKSLRAKIREVDSSLDVIRTQRGFGYSYDPNY